MSRSTVRSGGALLAVATLLVTGALLLSGCSSDDDEGAPAATDEATDTTAADGTGDTTASPAVSCEDLVTQAEVEALFGEPATLERGDAVANNADLGQTTCTWTTVEDDADTEDLASQLLVLQLYDGSEMSGANFFQPEVQYPDAEPLDIGDQGFVDVSGGVDVGFLDGDTAGFLSWSSIDLSGEPPDAAARKDAVVDLARTFHDRVS